MTPSDIALLDVQSLFDRDGILVVYRAGAAAPEPFICVSVDGPVIAYCGHVDLGQGIRTALTQIVAEELDLRMDQVEMVLGDTARAPNQGATIASDTIQTSAVPLRKAAAQARAYLVELAAGELSISVDSLTVGDGIIRCRQTGLHITFSELLPRRQIHLLLDEQHPVKAIGDYKIVGQPQARIDIPAKATGDLVFVHDMRVDGMLHGRVVRPPYAGLDHGPFVGTSLLDVDQTSIAHIPNVQLVREGDFIGVVAEREEHAAAAAEALRLRWRPLPDLPSLDDIARAISANPRVSRRLQDKGDVDAALAAAATRLNRRYLWPYQMHASIGPSCALADVRDGQARIWSGTQNPHPLQADIAMLLGTSVESVEIIRMEAAGCYGRNCADDVSADAALLSSRVGAPVRVQLTREQEHLWEPKGAAQLIEVEGGLDAEGCAIAYDFQSSYPSNLAPTLALLLTGRIAPIPATVEMGDRTAIAPYDYANMRVTIHDMPPIVRASWLRGVSALPNSFAHESWIDEAAAEAKVDPVEYRLRYLRDERARDLVLQTAKHAAWEPRTEWGSLGRSGDILFGRGFAYALYVHSKFPGYGAAWSAWVADVEVNRATGEVAVTRITNGHDAGMMVNPAGVQHQIHGNVIQSISRATREQVLFAEGKPASTEWGSYPIIPFPDVPHIDTLMINRPDQPPLGAGESASVPSAAAIANAIYDACGVRFREPPFTADKVRHALAEAGRLAAASDRRAEVQPSNSKTLPKSSWKSFLGGASLSLSGVIGALLFWQPAIAPIEPLTRSPYSAETIERGRQLAAIGDCASCHTAAGGQRYAGGFPIESPFGTIYGTNITPDRETGIGAWSYAAFERAMRRGISRDGHHLYPAFPYTHFTRTSDEDLQALYAYLMSLPPTRNFTPKTELGFPYGARALLSGWNMLFLKQGQHEPDPSQSADWNRGRYLVDGLGHCSGCHSPRNLAGGELGREDYMAGAMVEGWEAPALGARSVSALDWTEQDYFDYLRTGYSSRHGSAAGPMAPVVRELRDASDTDVRAMSVYLASLSTERAGLAAAPRNRTQRTRSDVRGQRLFEGACAACHEGRESAELFGIRPQMTFNTNVRSGRPDNLIRVILDGLAPDPSRHGAMPAFRNHLTDRQLADLTSFVRTNFAPDLPAWENLDLTVAKIRQEYSRRT